MITSTSNPKIKYIKTLQAKSQARRDGQVFVCEGVRLVEEAQAADWPVRLILHTAELNPRGREVVDKFTNQGVEIEMVAPHVMQAVSETETPQGILAVLLMQSLPLPSKLDFVVIPDNVRDPGNLGTIMRSAAAAGVNALLVPVGNAEMYAPKVMRAAMGAHFHIPVQTLTWQEISRVFRKHEMRVFLAASKGREMYTQADFRQPLALIVGSEAQGAGSQAHELADSQVYIPMPGQAESLNVSVAAAVLMFEVVRQRGL